MTPPINLFGENLLTTGACPCEVNLRFGTYLPLPLPPMSVLRIIGGSIFKSIVGAVRGAASDLSEFPFSPPSPSGSPVLMSEPSSGGLVGCVGAFASGVTRPLASNKMLADVVFSFFPSGVTIPSDMK